MITLLRAPMTTPPSSPRNRTLAELHKLVASSGIHAELSGEIRATVSAPAQRMHYRAVQEAQSSFRVTHCRSSSRTRSGLPQPPATTPKFKNSRRAWPGNLAKILANYVATLAALGIPLPYTPHTEELPQSPAVARRPWRC
jgi:hypothetical protein